MNNNKLNKFKIKNKINNAQIMIKIIIQKNSMKQIL